MVHKYERVDGWAVIGPPAAAAGGALTFVAPGLYFFAMYPEQQNWDQVGVLVQFFGLAFFILFMVALTFGALIWAIMHHFGWHSWWQAGPAGAALGGLLGLPFPQETNVWCAAIGLAAALACWRVAYRRAHGPV